MNRDGRFLADLGRAVAAHRHAAGLTQQDVARRCGLTRSSVANIEAGRQDPTTTHLALIARAIGLTPARLFDAATFDSEVNIVEHLTRQNRQLRDRIAAVRKALDKGTTETQEGAR